MAIYLLHFAPAYKHAKHYLGYADDIAPRIYAHLHGQGARLTQVAKDAGSTLILVRIWEGGTRSDERKFKIRSHVPELCPICQGLGVQLPLLLGEPAYVTSNENEMAAIDEAPISAGPGQLLITFTVADAIDEDEAPWAPADFEPPADGDLIRLIWEAEETEEYEEDVLDREFWARGNW